MRQTLHTNNLIPRPCSPRKAERGSGLVFWPYFVKNVIIAYLYYPEPEFLTPQSMWSTTQPGLQKLETAAKSIGTAENRLRDEFSLFPIRFKIYTIAYFMQL